MKSSKVLVIDNYDSFTYNLVQIIEEFIGFEPMVIRNDQIGPNEISEFDFVIFSPGPGVPKDAGNLMEIIQQNSSNCKMLGVCLGLQAIGEAFGSELRNLPEVYHGIQTQIKRTQASCPIFTHLNDEIEVGRYHSWVIDNSKLSNDLIVTSFDEHGEIMSLRHKDLPIYGVQFHPESILTPLGHKMIANFFQYG